MIPGLHPPRPDLEERAGAAGRRGGPPLGHPGRLRAGGARAPRPGRGPRAGRHALLDGARVPRREVLRPEGKQVTKCSAYFKPLLPFGKMLKATYWNECLVIILHNVEGFGS